MKRKKKLKGIMTPPPKRIRLKSKSRQAQNNDSLVKSVLRAAGLSHLW